MEKGAAGGHACDWETSVMLMTAPQYVRMDKAQRGFVGEVSPAVLERFFSQGVTSVSEIGVMGDPTNASAERGARYFKALQDVQEQIVREHLAACKQ